MLILLKKNPLFAFAIPFWWAKGRAHLKAQIASRVRLDPAHLPFHEPLVDYLRAEKAQGRRLLLVTASDEHLAQPVAEHVGLFSEVLASNGHINLRGKNKAARLAENFGERGYDYAGNSSVDLPVWRHAREALVVNAGSSLATRAAECATVGKIFGRRKPIWRSLTEALQPHQWLKNLIVFIPLIISHQIAQWPRTLEAVWVFLAFSLCASAVYLLNDLSNLEADRQHSLKKMRPLAAGDLPLQFGFALAPLLLAAGIVIACTLPAGVLVALMAYLALTTGYTWRLIQIPLVNVLCLAGIYTIVLVAGYELARMELTFWLLFWVLLFLGLAFAQLYGVRREDLPETQGLDCSSHALQSISSEAPLSVAFVGGVPGGGATTFLCNLGGELVRRKIPVHVLSLERSNPLASDFERAGIPVRLQDERLAILEDRIEAVLRALAEMRPNVVVANLGGVSYETLRYAPQGVLRVAVAHADHPIVYDVLRHYPAHVDFVAVVSQTIKAKLEKMPEFTGMPVKYLPLGVPMPEMLIQRHFKDRLRILYLGRLGREQKRVQLFPEILRDLKDSGIPFDWTIAGDGPDEQWLKEALSKTNGASEAPRSSNSEQNVWLKGPVSYADVPKLLSTQDVFLLASDYEGLPLTLLEAMGNGLVPVVSDLPSGVRELVDEKTGRRVAPDDVHGYAREITWLHEHREEMARLSANARDKVHSLYSINAMTDRWLNAFRTAPPPREWPRSWKIQAPLTSPGSFRFSPLGRSLRRIRLKFRRA
jgi:glycosyltransferase involved in cell wall biosynthesis